MVDKRPTVYSTDDPTVVAAFLDARRQLQGFVIMVTAAARELGKNTGVMRAAGTADGGAGTTIGLAVDDPDDPPAGWVYNRGRKMLRPVRGRAGNAARQWLDDHQPPPGAAVHAILARFGLPLHDLLGNIGDMSYRFSVPTVGHVDGVVWALYQGHPGVWYDLALTEPSPPWVRRRLSEFYAAEEAATARSATVVEAARCQAATNARLAE